MSQYLLNNKAGVGGGKIPKEVTHAVYLTGSDQSYALINIVGYKKLHAAVGYYQYLQYNKVTVQLLDAAQAVLMSATPQNSGGTVDWNIPDNAVYVKVTQAYFNAGGTADITLTQ